MREHKNYRLQLYVILALGCEAAYVIMALAGDLSRYIPLFLAAYALAFVCYALAAAWFFGLGSEDRGSIAEPGHAPSASGGGWLAKFIHRMRRQQHLTPREIVTIGLVFGVLFRLTMLFAEPSLSSDLYRYVWDARVAAHDINPYEYPPEAPALASLRDAEVYSKIEYKSIPTIYPPVLQMAFHGIYKLHPSPRAFKAAFVLFELLTVMLLFLIFKRLGLRMPALLLYVWNPLMVVEIAGSGHVDSLGIFLLILALWLVLRQRWWVSAGTLALAFLTKFLSVLFVPFVALRKGDNKLAVGLVFVIVVAACYLPYAEAGADLFSSLGLYAAKWRFNDSLFAVLYSGVHAAIPESWVIALMIEPYDMAADAVTVASRRVDLALFVAKALAAGVFLIWLVYWLRRFGADWRRAGPAHLFSLGVWLLGGLLLLSPTVHPWYLCWLVPFLAVAPHRAWLLLTGLVSLSYITLIDYSASGVWSESLMVKWVEYLPFYGLLLYDLLRRRWEDRKRRGSKSPEGVMQIF